MLRPIRFCRDRFRAYVDAFLAIAATLSISAIAHIKDSAVFRLQDAISLCDSGGHGSQRACYEIEHAVRLKSGSLVVYAATFTVVAEIWTAHVLSMLNVRKVPRKLVVANLILLLPAVAVLPIAGAVASAYLAQESDSDLWSSGLFIISLALVALAMLVHNLCAAECPGSGQQLQAVWPLLAGGEVQRRPSGGSKDTVASSHNPISRRQEADELQHWRSRGVSAQAAARLATRRAWVAFSFRVLVLGASLLVLHSGHSIPAIAVALASGLIEAVVGGHAYVTCCAGRLPEPELVPLAGPMHSDGCLQAQAISQSESRSIDGDSTLCIDTDAPQPPQNGDTIAGPIASYSASATEQRRLALADAGASSSDDASSGQRAHSGSSIAQSYAIGTSLAGRPHDKSAAQSAQAARNVAEVSSTAQAHEEFKERGDSEGVVHARGIAAIAGRQWSSHPSAPKTGPLAPAQSSSTAAPVNASDVVVQDGRILPQVLDVARRYSLLDQGRLESFTDGVYSIVATLIVLEINVPTPDIDDVSSPLDSDSTLQRELKARPRVDCPAIKSGDQPTFFCWWHEHQLDVLSGVLTVLLVGALWMAHVSLFALIRRKHSGPVRLSLYRTNSAICAVVGFLPFAVSLSIDFKGQPYGPVLLGGSLCFIATAMGVLMMTYAWEGSASGEPQLGDCCSFSSATSRTRQQPLLDAAASYARDTRGDNRGIVPAPTSRQRTRELNDDPGGATDLADLSRTQRQLGVRLVLLLAMGATLLVLALRDSSDLYGATIGVLAATVGLFLAAFGVESVWSE